MSKKDNVLEIRSVKDLLSQLEDVCPDAEMYRGQACDWALLPGIGRYPKKVQSYGNWRILHDALVRQFYRLGHPHIKNPPSCASEGWVLAQHYGLPTRLLDTSTNPLKALFFTVNDPTKDESDGVFWAFTYAGWREELDEEYRKFWETEAVPFLPPQLNPRLTAQEAAFISYPLPENEEPLVPLDKLKQEDILQLDKFIVPAKVKRVLRRELAKFGIQYRLLFPDLDGVAKSIKLTELHL